MLKFLSGAVTQSAADTFTAAEMATGLSNVNLAYRIRGIMLQFPGPVEVDSFVTIQLARRSSASALSLGDRTLIWQMTKTIKLTTSGIFVYEPEPYIPIPKDLELLIVEDPIYIFCNSGTTGVANTARARIFYEEVRITDLAKVTALAESLNA